VTSGGWGNCGSGGQTWYQPVNEILGRYGLRLHTV
jgi:streptogrisin C